MEEKSTNNPGKHPDPITGEPGAHPVGVGVGATGGGVAGAAIGGAVGAAVGAAIGGVAGAVSGRGVAEAVNPTQEEAYWRENHPKQFYAGGRFTYEHYAPAYRTGYEGVMKYVGKKYEEIEEDLVLDYEKHRAGSPLSWDEARHATHAAWDRVSGRGFTARPRSRDAQRILSCSRVVDPGVEVVASQSPAFDDCG